MTARKKTGIPASHTTISTNKGFGTERRLDQKGDGMFGQVHEGPTQGLSLVINHQVEQAAEMVSDAEKFAKDAARALAKRSHRLASGRTFADHYVRELNALCEAEPFGGFGEFNWEQAHELLEDLGKPALPSPTPRFLPNA
jgi:hypothetical protein